MNDYFVFVSYKSDRAFLDRQLAIQSNDSEKLTRLSQDLESANLIFKLWAESKGGRVVYMGNDEGKVYITASHLHELPDIQDQYKSRMDSSVSIGVGKTLEQADKSLKAAQDMGGDCIRLYDSEVDKQLALKKADEDNIPALEPQEEKQHSQVGRNYLNEFNELAQHSEAQEQQEKSVQEQGKASEDLKSQVVGVLKEFRSQLPILEQMKQKQPQLYQSMLSTVQAMTALARQAFDVKQEVQKSEKVETSPEEQFPPENVLHKDMLSGGRADDLPDEEFDEEQLIDGIQHELEHTDDPEIAKEIAKDHLREDPDYYRKLKSLEKATRALEAGKTGVHQVNYPVGTTRETGGQGTRNAGKKKIQLPNGKTVWRQMRANSIAAKDGTPTSSRNPNPRSSEGQLPVVGTAVNPEVEKAELAKEAKKEGKKDDKPFHGYNPEKHSRTGGLSEKGREKMNRETGSNLKAPVTKKNPKGKEAARKKSFCARMSGVKGPTSKDGKLTPKGAALKRWRCSKNEDGAEGTEE